MSRAALRIAAGTCAVLAANGCASDQVEDLTADAIASQRGAMTAVQREADEAGWKVTWVAPDGSGFSATRPLDGRRATLSVALNLDRAFTPAPGIFVSLGSSGE